MNTYVVKIDLALSAKLEADLLNQGFELSRPLHTVFQAKKKGVSCTLYTSGKLTVQGKDKGEFIEFYLEPLIGDFSYTHPTATADTHPHIGIDEAGKGDFFGPLVIAGVYADEAGIKKLIELGVQDSKRINDKIIDKLAPLIIKDFSHSIVRLNPKKYNELYQSFGNLNRLLAWGHATAIEELHKRTGCKNVLIDQFASESVVETALQRKKIDITLVQRHKGEEDPVVAAASILARHGFVHGIDQLGQQIGFDLPKGASALVIKAGRRLVQAKGPEILGDVAKLHFKTKQEILQQTLC